MIKREREIWFWLVGLGVTLALLYVLSGVLLPFVAGLAVAYFLDPLTDRVEGVVRSRSLATAIILLTFFAAVGGLGVALFPLLQAQFAGILAWAPEAIDGVRATIEPYIARLESQLNEAEITQIKDAASGYAGSAVSWIAEILKNLFIGGRAFVNTLSLLLIMPVVAFFMLRDWDKLVSKVDSLFPRRSAETIRGQFKEMDNTVAGFVRGQALVCLTLGTIYGTGLTLVGLDFGLLIGIGTGLMAFVPYVGMMIGSVIALGVAAMQFTEITDFLMVAAVFGFGQTLDAAFLTPNLVGGRVRLHPVWIIFALMTGGTLFGFTGVLLAVPTAAMIGVLVRFLTSRYLESDFYHNEHGGQER